MISSRFHCVKHKRFWVAACVAACMMPALSHAVDLQVDPVHVELTPNHRTEAINITNSSDQPSSFQVQAYAWSQIEGKDTYNPTRELLVAPPIFTVGPKSRQTIRVALRRPADPASELAYRIFLQELPPAPPPGFNGLQIAIRFGLPIFVKPLQGVVLPKPIWSAAKGPENTLRVTLLNQGNIHLQVSDFSLYAADSDHPIATVTNPAYILAGQRREWVLKSDSPEAITTDHLRIKGRIDARSFDSEVVVEKP